MTFFNETKCWKCGEPYGLRAETETLLRRSGQTFYCPFGHGAVFSKTPVDSEADKLRRERDRLKQENARLEEYRLAAERAERAAHESAAHQARRAAAMKGVATRMKNRVAAGVCPCCNRTFANLQRHMQSKHAGFIAEEIAPEGATLQ